MKATLFISVFLVAALVVILFFLKNEDYQSLSTDTSSSQFDSDEKKVAFLKKYLVLPSNVEMTEFHIIYHDNSRGLAGPSDWHIVAAIKILPAHVDDWIKDMQPQSEQIDLSWGFNLLPKGVTKWKLISTPKIYRRPGSVMAVFRPEGIIFKKVETY